ncbi:flagellar filament capping protein FliD [Paenibacillus sp. FSL E2-0178]|uniref:flagellar filament capping protein FliD n=1 Tax=Paenibacillus sp. FSL E2-0178 TaxID=2921361 RepID=UPI0031583EB2
MVTRVNGFSGMDIDSMVKSMMTAKKAPLDKMNQQKQLLNWTRESYREVSSKLYDFRYNKLITKYGSNDVLTVSKAVVSGNTDAIKATASSKANGIDMEVSVSQLATKTTVTTAGAGSGKQSTNTLASLQSAFDGSVPTSDEAKAKEFKLVVNDQTFTFKGSTDIQTVIATINDNSLANVTATFDETTGKFALASKTSGTTGTVTLGSGTDDNTLLSLFNKKDQTELQWQTETGKDSISKINGVEYIKPDNTFTVNGVAITLLTRTNTSGTDIPSKITTQTDTTAAVDVVKSFVSDYNTLIAALNTKIDEEKYRDYAPLTDEQKAEMKEADITTWTLKAQSGLLKNDDIIKSVLSEMRAHITEQLGGLAEMGITTGTYAENGKLILDENKLKTAMEANPTKLMNILQGPPSAPTTGIFDKMASSVFSAIEKISNRAGTNRYSADLTSTFKEESVMGKKLKEYNSRITTMLTYLDNQETRLYKQFTAMETAMNKLQSQSSSLFSTSS